MTSSSPTRSNLPLKVLKSSRFALVAQKSVVLILSLIGTTSLSQDLGNSDVLQLPEEEVYEGEYVDGLRHGQGKLIYPDGRIYEGLFEGGYPSDSDGLMRFIDGSTYQGTFVNGEMQGYGTYRWLNGDIYVGTFTAGSISGSGRMYWADTNTTYVGSVESGQMHGLGRLVWPDGRAFAGSFNQNVRHGFGVQRLVDGSIYRGFFQNNSRHGDGVYHSQDGTKEFQRWNEGEVEIQLPIEAIERCRLVIENEEWMFESVDCIDGLAHGSGLAVRLDGLAYIGSGRFVAGHLVSGVITSLVGQNESTDSDID